MSQRLLVVEDEMSVALGLVDVLRVKGYAVDHAARGDEGLELALRNDYALILLDVMLPGLSGFDVLRQIRQRQRATPIIMLTARGTEVDRVLGFELGVDDYVTKPFSLLELLGRIGAVLRRTAVPTAQPLPDSGVNLGDVTIDFDRFLVTRNGQTVELPARAFDILRVLSDKQGQVVSRDSLIDAVWGEAESITLRTLNNLIVKIRQAIEENPDQPRHLKTIHGVGYRLEQRL